MQGSLVFLLTILTGSLFLVGCGPKSPAPEPSSSGAAGAVAWSANGWSDAERTEYHHLAEGSELMPYVLLANIVSVKTGKPFLENMERFGFLPDATSDQNH